MKFKELNSELKRLGCYAYKINPFITAIFEGDYRKTDKYENGYPKIGEEPRAKIAYVVEDVQGAINTESILYAGTLKQSQLGEFIRLLTEYSMTPVGER